MNSGSPNANTNVAPQPLFKSIYWTMGKQWLCHANHKYKFDLSNEQIKENAK